MSESSRPARWRAPVRQDLRYALRQLRRAPVLAAALLVVLGGGIGLGVSLLALVQSGASHPAPLLSPRGLPLPVQMVEVTSVAPQPVGDPPPGPPRWGGAPSQRFSRQSVAEVQQGSLATLLSTLGGAVGLALAVACTNLALLLLSRAAARRHEMAMRAVLGARPRRLLAQLLGEGMLLVGMGGALGFALALVGLGVLRESWPGGLSGWLDAPRLGWALAAGAGLPLLGALLASLAPLAGALGRDLHGRTAGGARTTPGRHEGSLRRQLSIVTVGTSFALLVAAGLLLRGFGASPAGDARLPHAHDTLAVRLAAPPVAAAERADFYAELLHELRSAPGVQAGSIASEGAWLGLGSTDLVHALLGLPTRPGILRPARYHAVSPGYFGALGIPVVRGREFTDRDRAGAAAVAVVNETFAHRLLPRVDPLGKSLQLGRVSLGGVWYTVVGVVRDPRPRGIGSAAEPVPALYLSILQAPPPTAGIAVRAAGNPLDTLPAVQRAVRAADARAALAAPTTLAEELARFRAPLAWFGTLFGTLALFATLLAALGLYGVVSFNVRRRTREIGIRIALGARPSAVARMITVQGVRLALAGAVLGVAGALSLGRLLQFFFHGVRLFDPVPYAVVGAVLVAAATLASYLPARAAARIDPVIALRAD